ncbi:MAG: TrkH family potassium uptake protein, partial [Acidithiobacillaceae bacterium]|nr:TrkH family potassium uptake protein [Acidithiobacillaceae bacterium]
SSQVLNIRRLSGVLDGDSQQQQVQLTDYVRNVLIVYLILTLLTFFALLMAGQSAVQSAIFAMAAVATGWCAPARIGINDYSGTVQLIIALASMSGAMTIGSYLLLSRNRWRDFFRDVEFRLLLLFIFIGTMVLGLSLYFSGIPIGNAFFKAFLLATSAQTTAGFSPLDLNMVSSFALVILIMLMFVGGSVGSTAGGIKLVRAWLSLKIVAYMIRSTRMSAHVVNPLRMEGRTVPASVLLNTLAIVMLTLMVMTLSWLAFLVSGYPALPGLFNVVSAMSTAGLSVGVLNVSTPVALKLVLCADMLFGRLEFVALLVLLAPRTWFGRRLR